MNKPMTLGSLLASLFPRSNRALSEKLDTEEYNELANDVQALNSRLNVAGNAVADAVNQLAVTAEQASAPVKLVSMETPAAETPSDTAAETPAADAPAEETPAVEETVVAAEITVEEAVTEEAAPEEEAPAEPVVASVPMETVTLAELQQLRADAADWNAAKAEYGVLKDWYARSTAKLPVGGATVDAADATPGKVKSWEKAPWNTK